MTLHCPDPTCLPSPLINQQAHTKIETISVPQESKLSATPPMNHNRSKLFFMILRATAGLVALCLGAWLLVYGLLNDVSGVPVGSGLLALACMILLAINDEISKDGRHEKICRQLRLIGVFVFYAFVLACIVGVVAAYALGAW